MPVVSPNSRKSLVELQTSDGSFYVRPSGWARMYLLWTFRNFQRLREQVLSPRQQRFIAALGRTPHVAANCRISRDCILGVVENVRIEGACRIAAIPASEHIGSNETPVFVFRRFAVRAELIATPSMLKDGEPINCRPFPWPNSQPGPHFFPGHLDPVASITYKRDRRGALRFAFATASAALVLGMLIQVRTGRQSWWGADSESALKAPSPVSELASAFADAKRPPQSFTPGQLAEAATIAATKPPALAFSSTQTRNTQAKPDILAQAPDASADSIPTKRLQVGGAPQRPFAYPLVPHPSLSGKVSLKAQIGTDGNVTSVEVLKGDPSLARAAVGAVRHWRYRPYEINGDGVEAETNITISFVGDEAISITFPETHVGLDPER